MQIISKHWTSKILKTPANAVNAGLIKEYTKVDNYKGRADQINRIMEYITKENYLEMRKRVNELLLHDSIVGSTNFKRFIDFLEGEDVRWIENINNKLEM